MGRIVDSLVIGYIAMGAWAIVCDYIFQNMLNELVVTWIVLTMMVVFGAVSCAAYCGMSGSDKPDYRM